MRAQNNSIEAFERFMDNNPSITVGSYLRSQRRRYVVKELSNPTGYSLAAMKKNPKSKTEIIKDIVCKNFNVTFDKINIISRKRELVEVRQCIFYFLRFNTKMSYVAIGAEFDQKFDNATVIYGINNWNDIKFLKENRAKHEAIENEIKRLIK